MDQDRHCLAQPSLYHLHAAYLALISAPSTSKNPCPLPVWGSIQARSFLAELAQEDDHSDTQARDRVAVPSASALDKGLNSLPTHWIQHNALCGQCGSVCIPGISSTTLRSLKGKTRAGSNVFECMTCLGASHKGLKQNRTSAADRAAKEASKAQFPSVRKRKRVSAKADATVERQQNKASDGSTSDDPREIQPVPSTKAKPDRPAATPVTPASSAVWSDTSRPLKRKSPTTTAPEKQDPDPPPQGAKIPQQEQGGQPNKAAAALAPPPAPPSQATPAAKSKSHNTSTAKQDHKAALRSLLMKDAKNKSSTAASKKGAEKHKLSAGGGGLRDFLADL